MGKRTFRSKEDAGHTGVFSDMLLVPQSYAHAPSGLFREREDEESEVHVGKKEQE